MLCTALRCFAISANLHALTTRAHLQQYSRRNGITDSNFADGATGFRVIQSISKSIFFAAGIFDWVIVVASSLPMPCFALNLNLVPWGDGMRYGAFECQISSICPFSWLYSNFFSLNTSLRRLVSPGSHIIHHACDLTRLLFH